MDIGFCAGSYTLNSAAIADEECLNWFTQTVESQGVVGPVTAYGGRAAKPKRALVGTPGLSLFCTFPEKPVRGGCTANGRMFEVAGASLYEVFANGTFIKRGYVGLDANSASLAFNAIQILIVSAGQAFCFTLDSNKLIEVTDQLAGAPIRVDYSDTYFIVFFQNSNKFQISQLLDGSTWPGQLVNEVSVFADNITSIICNHRELWVLGLQRSQPYQDTGSTEAFDVIPGALIEKGCAAAFAPCLLDNSVFWVDEDARGGRSCWRSNGYTPARVSTYAVEYDLSTYTPAQIAGITTYSYQDGGHLFWVLYIPGSTWNWVFDVTEGMWHKRAAWLENPQQWQAHWSWNHVYAFGLHLVGDWNSGNLYSMALSNLTDNGTNIRRDRRAPTVISEMERIVHVKLTLDFQTGQGPQPPLTDGDGNPRQPQVMLRWSDDRGQNWSNEHILNCGFAGQTQARAIQWRLGQSRYRDYEMSVSDPIQWTLVDAYLQLGGGQ